MLSKDKKVSNVCVRMCLCVLYMHTLYMHAHIYPCVYIHMFTYTFIYTHIYTYKLHFGPAIGVQSQKQEMLQKVMKRQTLKILEFL